tara:strand:+ start:14212 stop:15294 length:1083 start_codon:yes stop_codon:yes gene_type:complete
MDWEIFKGKKIILTGHSGFKGSWLMRWLEILGAEVIGISIDIPTDPSNYRILREKSLVKDNWLDIRNLDKLTKIFQDTKADMIFHLAAQALVSKAYENQVSTYTTNVIGSINVLQAAINCKKIPKIVMVTSDKCYKNNEWCYGYRENDLLGGEDPYSASKAAAEILIHAFFKSYNSKNKILLNLVTARAGNVIGGGDWAQARLVPDCMRAWANNKKVTIRSPHSTRPWQHVLEPLGGYLLLMEKLFKRDNKINGESFNFGPSLLQEITVGNLVESMATEWGGKASFTLHESQFKEAGLLKLNCDKANSLLGWRPVFSSSETFDMTIKWYKAFYKSTREELLDITNQQIKDAMNRLNRLET